MDYNMEMGDLLYRSKDFVKHCGVYIGNGLVLHHSPKKGTEIINYEDFSVGLDVGVVRTNSDNLDDLEERLNEILNAGGGYNALTNNCEHIATYMVYGRTFSHQVQGATIGAFFGYLLGRAQNSNNLILMSLIGGILGCAVSNTLRKYDNETHFLRS